MKKNLSRITLLVGLAFLCTSCFAGPNTLENVPNVKDRWQMAGMVFGMG